MVTAAKRKSSLSLNMRKLIGFNEKPEMVSFAAYCDSHCVSTMGRRHNAYDFSDDFSTLQIAHKIASTCDNI